MQETKNNEVREEGEVTEKGKGKTRRNEEIKTLTNNNKTEQRKREGRSLREGRETLRSDERFMEKEREGQRENR